MKFRVVIIILDFIILAVALVNGFFSLNGTCYECPRILFYGQFLDTVVYGLLLLIFFMCVTDMARESLPITMELTANFSAAILYFLALGLSIFVLFYYSTRPFVRIGLLVALGLLHTCVGLLFLFRDKLTRLT